MNYQNYLIPAASLLLLGACTDEDEEAVGSADLLIGEWELVSVDGEEAGGDYEDYSYSLTFEFQADGDLQFCYNYVDKVTPADSYEDCYLGEWSWINVGAKLQMSMTTEEEDSLGNIVMETNIVDLTLTKLTAAELEGTWVSDEAASDTYEVVFKKL